MGATRVKRGIVRRLRTGALAAVIMAIALLALVGPAYLAIVTTPDWRDHPTFDGQAYRWPAPDVDFDTRDATGTLATLALLMSWRGEALDVAALEAELELQGFAYRLDEVAALYAEQGFAGTWVEAGVGALPQLETPFLALLTTSGGRLVVVHELALGHVFVEDAREGRALIPTETFASTWSGYLYTFEATPVRPVERN